VFSTNGINILAGSNGIEAIQPIVIAISLVINNIIQFQANPAKSEALVNTLYFLFPYIGSSLAFLALNWFPASAFGGDTFCYFSGMVFAVVVLSIDVGDIGEPFEDSSSVHAATNLQLCLFLPTIIPFCGVSAA
jgi:UDP-N-acetylmuramyl pentapeptide phosphotransferase/UDP-N-acetylglucosamine-1-phosphate transferase